MVTDHVRTILRENIADILNTDERKIQGNQNFRDIGVDSTITGQLINRVNNKRKFKTEIDITEHTH